MKVESRCRLRRGDVLLLCSDGLSGLVRRTTWHGSSTRLVDLSVACDRLIATATTRRPDNITVVSRAVRGARIELVAFIGRGGLPGIRVEPAPDEGIVRHRR